MKKRQVPILFLVLTLVILLPVVSAQTYSGFSKFGDNIKLFFSSGDNKIRLALEIREKELNSAMYNAQMGNDEEAIKNLESAISKLKIVQEKVSPDTAEDVKNNIEGVTKNVEENTDADSEYFEQYLSEEEKTKLSAELSQKVFDYCDELATQDYDLMLEDEKCLAYSWMKSKVGERIEEKKAEDFEKIKEQISVCMNNPKKCDCEEVSLPSERANCEKYKALAIRCEFQNDGSACKEIDKVGDIGDEERETYEQKILDKYVPAECTESGIRDGEECKKFIITLYKPESECMKNGSVLEDEACGKKLVEENKIIKECIKNGQPVSPEECEEIMKEKSKPSGEEFDLMSGECKERGVYDPVACDEIVNLPRPCKDAGYYTKTECESFTLKQSLPQECVEANALTPEACEKLKLPQKCQGEAFSNEDCEAVFIKEKMPPECQVSGTYNFFKCAKLLYAEVSDISIGGEIEYLESLGINSDEIPDECFKDSSRTNFERDMDCDEALIKEFGIMLPPPEDTSGIPSQCMRGTTPVSPEECEEILGSGIIQNELQDVIPEICQEANVSTPEECGELLERQRQEQGIGLNMPEECIGISAEECKKIMGEKNITIKKDPGIYCEEGECEKICCKIEAVVEEPSPEYRRINKIDCQVPEGWVGEMREIVSDEYCETWKPEPIGEECENDADCPELICMTYPCLQYSCDNGACIMEEEEIKIPKECTELGIFDVDSCEIAMSKINAQRIIDGDKVVIDDDGNTDVITNDQINQITDDADKKSVDIKPDITKANEIKQEVNVIEDSINSIDEVGITIDEVPKTKDNEDVSPAPNIVDNDVAPGPQGIVGDQGSGDNVASGDNENNVVAGDDSGGDSGDSGGEGGITGEAIGSGNKESFLGKFLKRIF